MGDGRIGVLEEARDVMAGGGAGLAIGRAILEEPSPVGGRPPAGGRRARRVILTLDLGSSVTKVALWDPDAPAGLAGLTPGPGTR